MTTDFSKYSQKLVRAGLIEEGGLLLGASEGGRMVWQGMSGPDSLLEVVLPRLNLGAALLARPAEPYATIIDYLAEVSGGVMYPQDFETRLLLGDLPVISEWTEEALLRALSHRRAVLVPGKGILAVDATSPGQAFVVTSAVFFACFVKFFSDCLSRKREGKSGTGMADVVRASISNLEAPPDSVHALAKGPFAAEKEILSAIAEVGARTVANRLVDANFGNASYRLGDRLYITGKKSALDELDGRILAVPLGECPDGLAGRASTELPSHREIALSSDYRAILHGHPRFAVILSMDCAYRHACPERAHCHVRCPRERFILDIPVVSGEAGGGACGIHRTVPPAMKRDRGVIVYGHGVFTAGRNDFNEAYRLLADIEKKCRDICLERITDRR